MKQASIARRKEDTKKNNENKKLRIFDHNCGGGLNGPYMTTFETKQQ